MLNSLVPPLGRLIFVISPGRCGTAFLARLLQCIPDVKAFHEPEPSWMIALRSVQQNIECATRFLLSEKLPHISQYRNSIYVETSHLFCKGFLEPLESLGISFDLIVLRRPHREVALSMCQLGDIPGRTERGLLWIIHPGDPVFVQLPNWHSATDYQLCYWYCLEIEARARFYSQHIRSIGGLVSEVSLKELRESQTLTRIIEELRLPQLSRFGHISTYIIRQIRWNKQLHQKKHTSILLPPSLEEEERSIDDICRQVGP